ncbi:hypothetical protein [Variovorax sp. 770b2]|uniref:hypothetical protein n=1 Tax=Variovorax sp. 770b2 TaxID=1566271 RepID=UPI0008EDBE57|nr:hypothetical protein [Variovorax sp. 770b2]SFP64509.1 hypothetical protein SAMN03159339_3644 [Variovorax sp. 770b2]
MKIVEGRYGLPPLPSVEFALIWSEGGKTPCACRFGQMILEMPDLPDLPDLPVSSVQA